MDARDDADWSRKVRAGGFCSWPGCCGVATDAHHVVPRRVRAMRLLIENGVGLCRKHHARVESLGKSGAEYERVMRLLIGEARFTYLIDLRRTSSSQEAIDLDSGKPSREPRTPSSEDISSL